MPLLLRGVNRSGMEYAGSRQAAGIDEADLNAIAAWGANVIRLPFQQQWALDRAEYLTDMDWIVEQAARRGMYTILDLQWLDSHVPRGKLADGSLNFVPPLPDTSTLTLWRMLANRYRAETSVLLDLCNEPHDPLPGDTVPIFWPDGRLCVNRPLGEAPWIAWASQLIRAIREVNPDVLLLVSGIDWGYRVAPLVGIAEPGVIFAAHVYSGKGDDWEAAFGNVARRFPVFVAECGGTDRDLGWGESLFQYLRSNGIGWAAWSWVDHPHLQIYGRETAFGNLVRAEMMRA